MSTKKTSAILTNADALNKAILAVNKAAHKLADEVQVVLASVTFHALAHGNVTMLNDSILALGRGMRKQAAADWLLKFAPVLANTGKDAKEKPFVFSREKVETLLGTAKPSMEVAESWAEAAMATHWTELKEPPLVPAEFDIMAQLSRVVKQAETLSGKGTKIIHGELLEFVKRLATKAAPVPTELEGAEPQGV